MKEGPSIGGGKYSKILQLGGNHEHWGVAIPSLHVKKGPDSHIIARSGR